MSSKPWLLSNTPPPEEASPSMSQTLTQTSSSTLPIRETLLSSIKSEHDLAALKTSIPNRHTRRAVTKYYKSQNTLIEELLKPVGAEHVVDESDTLVKVKIAMYGSLGANILLFCLQLYAAVSSGSLSLFATMSDSFMDLTSNLVLVVAHVSMARKNLQRFPAGKKRFETAAIVVFSCIMGALSFELIIEAAKTIAAGDHTTALTVLNLGCIGVAITVKACLFAYCFMLRKYPSAGVLAQDHRNDIILNSTGILLSLMGQHVAWWIDPMGGIIIALWILINWSQTAIVNIQKFIGETAPPALLNKITYVAVSHHPDILQVDTVRAYSSGVGYFCEVDIVVDPLTTVHAAHDIAESLQVVLESLEEIERAFVHIDYNVTHHPEHLV